MKRKVIQIGESTQLVSIPRKWAQELNIKKGDELELTIDGPKLIVSTEKKVAPKKVTVDVTTLDRTSIMVLLRNLYKKGYDEIHINFSQQLCEHYRKKETVSIMSVIHEENNRLIGMDIMEQKENMCILKSISQPTIDEFDSMLRRIFLLTIDVSKDFHTSLQKNDSVLLGTLEEKHNVITKFVTYCLRILNKYGYAQSYKIPLYYHILTSIDKILDIIKYAARQQKKTEKLSKSTLDWIKEFTDMIAGFHQFFYKYDHKYPPEMNRVRSELRQFTSENQKEVTSHELHLLTQILIGLEILLDMTETRIVLEPFPEEDI